MVSSKVVLDASCPGVLPHNEQQIIDYKRRSSHTAVGPLSKVKGDDLYAVMLTAHLEDPNRQFVRDIKVYPKLAILVGSDK